MFYCLFIEKIMLVTKGRDLRDEYAALVGTKNQGNFENFCVSVCIAISHVLTQHITLIEVSTNTMEENQNITYLKNYTK